jgi:hypothetical protein
MSGMSPSQWITLFIIMYISILAPTLPGPLESILKNPLVKTFAIFWLIFQRTNNWKFSLLVASGFVVLLEGSCYLMYGREAFSNLNKTKWCPSPDLCFDENSETNKMDGFLTETDDFIKSLTSYVDADLPDNITVSDNETNV